MKPIVVCNGKVEVVAIIPEARSIHILVPLKCTPAEVPLPTTQGYIQYQCHLACRYLQKEGFIPDDSQGWVTHIGAKLIQG